MSKRLHQEILEDFELNSDDWVFLPRKSSRYYTTSKPFLLKMDVAAESSSSSSSSSAAVAESKNYLNKAVYYVPNRMGIPTVLNEYAAIRKTLYPTVLLNANNQYVVNSNSANADALQRLELIVPVASLLPAGSLSRGLWDLYDEFRVRCVKFEFHNAIQKDIDALRVEKFCWYIENHQQFDDEQATTMNTYQRLRTAMKMGEKVKPLGDATDRGFAVSFVPQIGMVDNYAVGTDSSPISDIPNPWVRTTDQNRNNTYRGPMLLFRRPYAVGDPAQICAYNVIMHVCIEFRNCDQEKL